jgi:hypothetical protein
LSECDYSAEAEMRWAEGEGEMMAVRAPHIPTYRERSALQALVEKDWLPATKLYPAGPSTILAMFGKGWLQRKWDASFGWTYCITPAGEAALKSLIPSKPPKSGRPRGSPTKGKA